MALKGFSEKEEVLIAELLYRLRKNVEKDWDYVKKGNVRKY